MKIAFVGDSYCADHQRHSDDHIDRRIEKYSHWTDSYLDIVLRHFTSRRDAKFICTGQKGMALFHAYQSLLEIVDEADYIIFCITSADRLATRHTMPCMLTLIYHYLDPAQDINSQVPPGNTTELDDFLEHYLLAPTPVQGKAKEEGRKILQAAADFYEYLYNDKFFEAIQVGLLMQMDALMLKKKKKCIWFESAPDAFCRVWLSPTAFKPTSGPYGNKCLYDISIAEKDTPLNPVVEGDSRNNHLSVENNQILAKLIINIIETDNFSPDAIQMEQYFKVR